MVEDNAAGAHIGPDTVSKHGFSSLNAVGLGSIGCLVTVGESRFTGRVVIVDVLVTLWITLDGTESVDD